MARRAPRASGGSVPRLRWGRARKRIEILDVTVSLPRELTLLGDPDCHLTGFAGRLSPCDPGVFLALRGSHKIGPRTGRTAQLSAFP